MPIQLTCSCSWTGHVKDELLGKRVRCPKCKEPILVSVNSSPPPPARRAKTVATSAAKKPEDLKQRSSGKELPGRKNKDCPACAQSNPSSSTLCRYCGEFLDGRDASFSAGSHSDTYRSYDKDNEDFSSDDENPFRAPNSLPQQRTVGGQNHDWRSPTGQTTGGRNLATAGQRVRARIMDGLLVFVLYLISCTPMFFVGAHTARYAHIPGYEANGGLAALALIWALGCFIAYAVWCIRLACRGKSPGKQQVGIHVLDLETGQPAGFLRNFLVREFLVGIIYGIPLIGLIFLIAEVVMLLQPARRTPRDLMANTSVVED
jgi:uncharacterized RDD family membrane protein YckC